MRIYLVLLVFIMFHSGCGGDRLEGTIGYITTEEELVYFPGDDFVLEGIFQNDQGLQKIEVRNAKLKLDFQQNLEGTTYYELYLERKLPELRSPEVHDVLILVTDGNNQVDTFIYKLDYAFKPSIGEQAFVQDQEDIGKWYLQGFVEDPQGIKNIKLNCLHFGELVNEEYSEGTFNYSMNEAFWYSTDATLGQYPLTLQVINQRGFSTTITDFEDVLGGN